MSAQEVSGQEVSGQEVSGKDKRSRTLERILGSALEEFAEHGYAGARTERIARRAGVNKASLYYHIGDKEALYDTVLRDCFTDLDRSIEKGLEGLSSSDERLDAFIRALAEKVLGSAHLAQIMLAELGSAPGRVHHEVSGCISSILAKYMDILSNARGREIMSRTEQDPMLGFAMIFGGLLFLRSRQGGTVAEFSFQNSVFRPSPADVAEGITSILHSAKP